MLSKRVADGPALAPPDARASSTSALIILPLGPVPLTWLKSIPWALA